MPTEFESALAKVINWHHAQHPHIEVNNSPCHASLAYLNELCSEIIIPTQSLFGAIQVTYGFTSHELLKWLTKNSPRDMAPKVDQHAAMELNSRGNRICIRDGAAFDFYIATGQRDMSEITQFIIEHLPFDRLYYYGRNKPIHVSIGPDNARYVQCRATKHDGTRVAERYAYGKRALELFS